MIDYSHEHEIVRVTKLHIIGPGDFCDGFPPSRKTFLIREHRNGAVDIVAEKQARCEADSSTVYGDLVLEVESG